ncbi:amidase family protein [uncultured Ruegeria sp.]|uniref:amidase family protein n=1 Tax=uncultured Ruegeria sp. TaxID=259304 RepID=UPI00262F49C9|nr:amidase family protein [uncultured Ruegeria sp.]
MNAKPSWSVDETTARLKCLKERLRNDDPQLKSVFTQTFLDRELERAGHIDPKTEGALAGAIVSIKDLLDVEGFVTKAGTKFMENDPPAKEDAEAVKRLREAGAVFVGHTNMTELAYSGLGLNPHYGTPENALLEGCIPGGSTSGGAITVARGIADIAIGTDTGGSLRIPAAFNGIVGFKPTQSTVPRKGCKALSRSLDSVGSMAKSVSGCRMAYEVLAGDAAGKDELAEPTFVIPTNYGMDDLDPVVKAGFDEAIQVLKAKGYDIREERLEVLESLKNLPVWHFSAIESRGEYDDAYQARRDIMDPRVAGPTRMGRADEVDAVSYRKTLNMREDLIAQYNQEMGGKVLIMPTVPIMPPTFADIENDEDYGRLNLQVLRNPSVGNVMNACSISLPFVNDDKTIGIMMIACGGCDLALLGVAARVEKQFV